MLRPAPISAVIPAYNAETFIQDAIESVRAQSLPVTELIVVADGCTDQTAEKAERHGARVLRATGRNVAAARNIGVRAATQQWIAFLDADDVWELDKTEQQWDVSQTFPDAAIISCDLSIQIEGKVSVRSDKEIRERLKNVSHLATINNETTYFAKVDGTVLRWFTISPVTALMNREVFNTAGYLDETFLYTTEFEFFARALKDHSFAYISKPLVRQRFRKNSHSSNLEGRWMSFISIVNRMLRYPEQYPPQAGLVLREFLKDAFLSYERGVVEKRKGDQ